MPHRFLARATLGLVALAGAGCSSEDGAAAQSQAPAPPPPPVVVASVVRAEVPVVREFVARTEARDTVTVEARVEAVLESMEFEEGKTVSAGQVLYRLDPDTYEANLAAAQAGLARARADLKLAEEQVSVRAAEAAVASAKASLGKAEQDVARLRPLAEKDAVPRQDLDTALAALDVAKAELDAAEADLENSRIREEVGVLQAKAEVQGAEASLALAELDLGYCTITSPIDGLIGRTQVDVGNLVGVLGSSELVEVSSTDPMRATFSVSEAEYLAFRRLDKDGEKNRTVQLVLADDTIYAHEGEVVTAERAVSLETGTLQVVAEFPNPPYGAFTEGLLRDGQFGRIRAVTQTLPDAVLVPQRAVMEQQGTKIVLVVGDDDVVALRTVQVSERHEDAFVVIDGLDGGERVIVEGQLKARPGMKVQPTDQAASAEPGGN